MDLLTHLCDTQGYFTRAAARAAGYDDRAIDAAARQGAWRRFRRGYYCLSGHWSRLDDVGQHRVRSAAVLDSLGDAVALSHVSASVAHGLDIWGLPLDRVHVTRLDGGAGRLEGDVVHHEGRTESGDLEQGPSGLVVPAARAALEAVGRSGGEVALAHLDALLRTGLCGPEELMVQFEAMARWPFTQHLHIPLRLADERRESIGESRFQWFCWRAGIPAPLPQYVVRDAAGRVIGTCDWAWLEHQTLGEFDGRFKYGRLVRPGQDPGDVVFAEKQREDSIREATGMGMIRVVWSDFERPRLLEERVRRMLRLAQ